MKKLFYSNKVPVSKICGESISILITEVMILLSLILLLI